jgi:hypothetical protein
MQASQIVVHPSNSPNARTVHLPAADWSVVLAALAESIELTSEPRVVLILCRVHESIKKQAGVGA